MDVRITLLIYLSLRVMKYYVDRSVVLLTLVVIRHYFGHFNILSTPHTVFCPHSVYQLTPMRFV